MKCLSIQNPWGPLICAGVKDVENRTWPTRHRGPILVHASGVPDSWINLSELPPRFAAEHTRLSSEETANPRDTWPVQNQRLENLLETVCRFYGLPVPIPDEWPDGKADKMLIEGIKRLGKYFPSTAIIGQVDVLDCVHGHDSMWAENYCWHWVLANPVQFEKPILGIKGKLLVWDFPLPEGFVI